jgi:hypothetical protein
MKKFAVLVLTAIVLFIPITSFGGTPIENSVLINQKLRQNPDVLESLVTFTKAHGYRCDSISAADILMLSRGYELVCNNFAYKFLIKDKGGKWVITVK